MERVTLTQKLCEYRRQFLQCPTQQRAYHLIEGSLLSGKLAWVASASNAHRPLSQGTIAYDAWTTFLRRLVRQLMIYGYAIFRARLTRTTPPPTRDDESAGWTDPESDDTDNDESASDLDHDVVSFSVPDGIDLDGITWNTKTEQWEVTAPDGTTVTRYRGKHGWRMIMLDEPLYNPISEVVTLQSAAARAYDTSAIYASLMANYCTRDCYNTTNVFTARPSEHLTGNFTYKPDDIGRDVHYGSVGIGGPNAKNMAEFQKKTASQYMAAENVSKELVNAQPPLSDGAAQRAPGMLVEPPVPKHVLRMPPGHDIQEVGPKRPQDNYSEVLRRLKHDIGFMWKVPPQAWGENVSAERMSGSDRLSQQSLAGFQAHLATIVVKLNLALAQASIATLGSTGVVLRLELKLGTYALQQLTPILTDAAAKQLYAENYRIDPSIFSDSRLRHYIDQMHEEGTAKNSETRKGNAHDSEANSGKTQAEQKQDARDRKNTD